MKRVSVILSAIVLALPVALVPSVGLADTAANLEKILGKRMYSDAGYFVIRRNGTLSGKFDVGNMRGAWELRDGQFCRTVQVADYPQNSFCQRIDAVDGGMRFTDVTKSNRKPRVYTFRKP